MAIFCQHQLQIATNPTVCHIVCAANLEELIVTWWITHDDISQRQDFLPPPPVPIESYSNVLKCLIKELFEVRSSSSTIHKDNVKDIAFIFHIMFQRMTIPIVPGYQEFFLLTTVMISIICCRKLHVSITSHFPLQLLTAIPPAFGMQFRM